MWKELMPARGHVGPTHITRPRQSFQALFMLGQLFGFGQKRVLENLEDRFVESGELRVIE